MDGAWRGEDPLADYRLEMETLFLQWLPYARLPDIWNDWALGWDRKAKQYLPIEGWREEWVVFGVMFDDSILFADTAAPDSPVYWLMTGYGTVENRRLIAPSVAGLMQTLLAIYDFEQKWQAEGRAVYDEEGCCAAAELSAALHDLLYRELPPECAAGFGKAFWVNDGLRPLDSDFKCNTRVPVVGTDSRIKHLAFRSRVFSGGSTHLEPCVSPDY